MKNRNQGRFRSKKSLERNSCRRFARERTLIVCEGEKTEINYFESIRRLHRLSATQLCVTNSKFGTSPQNVVDYARAYCREDNKFDKVYCVFDRDEHLNFDNALYSINSSANNIINDEGERITFEAVPSVPSFELWFLLHFRPVTKEIERDDICRELNRIYIKDYHKAATDHFVKTEQYLVTAYENAAKLRTNRTAKSIINPYTAVDMLVKSLLSMEIKSFTG